MNFTHSVFSAFIVFALPVSAVPAATRLPPEKVLTCMDKKGDSFTCTFDQGLCYVAIPLKSPPQLQGAVSSYDLSPCKEAPLVLPAQQQELVSQMIQQQQRLLSECRSLQKEFSTEKLARSHPLPSLEETLWKLTECLRLESDIEYAAEKESALYARLLQILELLTQYPQSAQKAQREMGVIQEEYYQNTGKALEHYKKAMKPNDTYMLISLGRTACLSAKPAKSKEGLENYLKAIEAGIFQIDVNNVDSRLMSLNALLEHCGYKNLIPILDAEPTIYVTKENKSPNKTLAFIKKHL